MYRWYSLCMNAGAGLFFEVSAELVYPLGEVVSGTMLTLVYNAFSAVYTLLGSTISPTAMNWILTGESACWRSCGLCRRVGGEQPPDYSSGPAIL